MSRFRNLAIAFILTVTTFSARAEKFIRVEKDDHSSRLQTAVTRYEKNGVSVDLIGAIHIADKAYYETLEKRFKSYDALLFEMIGGERYGKAKQEINEAAEHLAENKEKDLSGLHKIYEMAAKFLNLSGQLESIDYTAANFIHADLTYEEFGKMQKERGESLLGFAIKAAKAAPKPAKEPDAAKLLSAMLSGKSNLVKLEIVHTLGDADDQIAAFTGANVIISDRNQRCVDVMNREIIAGRKKIGIFYGAAHFPDMEKRLFDQGFKRTKQEWITAWDIPKKEMKPAVAVEKEAA
ncbi:MAG: hypothetical protein H8M99_15950 [Gloeobacteraceae cyanobacterium ES-bin-144]|nr:hypothetical protein [Verrucomicrobiales bacterium]